MQMERSTERRHNGSDGVSKWRNGIVCAVLVASVFQVVGCKTSSPVMLQQPSEKKGDAAIPAKIGVNPIIKNGGSRISDIGFTIFFVYWIDAKMPRRVETDYVLQAVADHINDSRIFQCAYITPFDSRKVNLTMDVVFDKYLLSNAGGGVYATVMNLPFINLLTLVGVPQEIFKSDMQATCILKTTAGAEISRYTFSSKASDAVTIYAMPYGNYLWYESMFRQQFDQMMTSFYRGIEADKAKILAAIQNPK
jgi:hypothetical protein